MRGTSVGLGRETQIEAWVEPGRYAVVPTSTGGKFAAQVGRTSSTAPAPAPAALLLDGKGKLTAVALRTIDELFYRLNETMDGILDRSELDAFQMGPPPPPPPPVLRSIACHSTTAPSTQRFCVTSRS